SAEILAEYEDVLYRPRLNLPAADVGIVLNIILQYGKMMQPTVSVNAMPDEDDRVFFDTAKCAEAYLVTGNIKHFPNEPFVITPAEFLNAEHIY
ncbi:MAG: putative toxin-antitoxin system toxin component, PIN family, partial [Oscillospiraceae bacterium]|nr:putative toxin-antitoxin system toxin component, PIN family [Oscillospiraceae bacterium]